MASEKVDVALEIYDAVSQLMHTEPSGGFSINYAL